MVRDQRKTVLVALGLAVAAYWIIGQLGEWRLATAPRVGVGLGLVNHLATEYWLLRHHHLRRSAQPGQMVRARPLSACSSSPWSPSPSRSVWWPDGIGLLLGLAIFRLIALMMTSVPLLKELKSQ